MATNLRQIEDMFHRAMEFLPEERAGYLDRACSDDNDLRLEVDSLIQAYESDSGLLDEAAVTLAMRVLGSTSADSMKGKEVGPYKILNLLGQGGMGAVYLAENRRVNKKVALKFLSAEFFEDNWGKRQLIKEAQAVAMLDHPNICAVYDFEEVDDHSFIVMQYIEGQTLADLIRKKSVKPGQYVSLAQQIANALAAAHAHGIIHRDIKPRNIMVTPSEQVKVLDFGLAKTMQKSLEEESISQLSRDGLLVGTVAYMSPEQLRGEKLDYRSDIFSLGTVLYEMGCGKNPFAHKTNSKGSKSNAEVISAIMAEEPQSLRQVALNCPKGFDHVVDKCLKKDRAERYQSAAELLIDLDDLQKGVVLQSRVNPYVKLRVAALAAMVLLALFVGVSIYLAWGSSRQTLAVLPITCDEATIKTQCVGPALTADLVKALSRRSGVRVTSSQVVPSLFGPRAASPQKVGRDMDADIVIFGKISQGEKGLMLTLRIERVKDGSKITEESEPLNADNLPMLAQWISLNTAMQLQLPMNEDDRVLFNALATQQNQNAEAVQLYNRGRTYWNKRDGENIKNAIDYFLQATEKDPLFAKAYAGLADCYVFMTTVRYGKLTDPDAMKKAESAAKTALSLDDGLAEAHSAYATVLMRGKWDWDNAEREFKRAIAILPDYSPAHLGYSSLLTYTGRMGEALAESKLAMDWEPFSAPAILNHCRTQYYARQFFQADACLDQLSKEQPNFETAKYMHAIVYIQLGRVQEAIAVYEEIYAKDKKLGGAMLGFSYGIANRRDDAKRILAEMQELQAKEGLPPHELAIIYLGLDDLNQAFPLFQKAVDDKFPATIAIFFAPMFDRLRSDSRFAEMAKAVKLPSRLPVLSAVSNSGK
jgi:tRNA A-37 threonylcarbamoyl transferase component Bud32/tetratricopeptide (TPR) repeat protein